MHILFTAYFVYARIEMEYAIENGVNGVRLLDDNYSKYKIGIGLSPVTNIQNLQSKINTFIYELRKDGTLDEMYCRWVIQGNQEMPTFETPENPTFTLKVGTTGTVMPYSFFYGEELRGYDIELAYRFAEWLGASVEFKVYDFGGTISAVTSGDIDCIMSNLYMMDEVTEAIPFSDVLFEIETTAMVRDNTRSEKIKTLSDFEQSTIGIMTGTNFHEHVSSVLPKAKLKYYNTTADLINALKAGKIDAFAADEPNAITIMNEDPSLKMLSEILETLEYGFIFPKDEGGEQLRDKFNEFLSKLKNDGTLEKHKEKWFKSSNLSNVEFFDYRRLENGKSTLKLAIIQNPPFSFSKEDVFAGYEVELFALFCQEYGYDLEVTDINMDALMNSVQSGKFDVACCGISITEERKETVYFSESDYSGGTILMILNEKANEGDKNIFASIAESFEKTFIRENRWKLFLEGIGTTLIITVSSIISGTLLGYCVFMICRKGNKIANSITRFCLWLIHGMPVVVLLMILYYVIFGSVNISGTIVSILGFMLIFGSAVFNMLKTGVGTVDKGQAEAAYALGYTDRRTFYRIILPQALPHIMPLYKGEITSLIKATAVVGYVASQDLTKAGDIVRSRTYEAFFPLIAVAVIYFILAALLNFIVKRVEICTDPKKRKNKKLLKGVV